MMPGLMVAVIIYPQGWPYTEQQGMAAYAAGLVNTHAR